MNPADIEQQLTNPLLYEELYKKETTGTIQKEYTPNYKSFGSFDWIITFFSFLCFNNCFYSINYRK